MYIVYMEVTTYMRVTFLHILYLICQTASYMETYMALGQHILSCGKIRMEVTTYM